MLRQHSKNHTYFGDVFNIICIFTVACLSSLFIFGCAQNKQYEQADESRKVFIKESRPVSSGKYRAVVLDDLDNDGNLDVVAGGSAPRALAISYGDGKGGMSAPQYLDIKGEVQSLAVADLNEDGLKDIVISVQRSASGLKVWQNLSERKWTGGAGPIGINNYQGIATADFNRDGHIDLAAANASSDTQGGIQVWLGDGKGNWSKETGPTVTGKYMDVAVADFNEDGVLDLAGAGWGIYGTLQVWFGDGTGNWASGPPLHKGNYYGLGVGDLDRDGHIDILAASYREGVNIFRGDGTGAFVKVSSPQESGSFWDIILVNIAGDGSLGILASSLDALGIKAWNYNGKDYWTPLEGRFPSQGTFYSLAAADINKDGYDDICAASLGEGIKFWKGRGESVVGYRSDKRKPVTAPAGEAAYPTVEENDVYTMVSGFPEYKIGPGDVLEITLWQGATSSKEEVLVRPDGKISFGFVEDLFVKGFTPTHLDNVLTGFFKQFVRQPRLDVVVKEFNSKFVTLTGAIGRRIQAGDMASGAGEYALKGKVSLLEMVSKAGGPTKDANLREVHVRRKDGQSIILDLNRAIFQGDPSQDIILDNGDLVVIPNLAEEANRVYVFGEVDDPGLYTFSGYEMRIFDAISKAGGPTVFATPESTKVVRGDVTHPEIISVNLKRLIEQGDQTQNVLLASGDLVYVPRRFWGDINIFWKRVRPLYELIFFPARIINEYDYALDTLSGE